MVTRGCDVKEMVGGEMVIGVLMRVEKTEMLREWRWCGGEIFKSSE